MTVSGSRMSTPGFNERSYLLVIRIGHLVERHRTEGRVVDLRTNGGLFGRWSNRTGNEAGPGGRGVGKLVTRPASARDRGGVMSRTTSSGNSNSSMPTGLALSVLVSTMSAPAAR